MTAFESRKSTALQGLMAPLHDKAGEALPSRTPALHDAMLSYDAGLAVMAPPEGDVAINLDKPSDVRVVDIAYMLMRGFCKDPISVKVPSLEALRDLLEIGRAKVRGLDMMSMLMNGEDGLELRETAGRLAEERLQRGEVEDFVANRLHRKAFSADADINTALQLAIDNGWTRAEVLLREIVNAQPLLTELGTSLESLPVDVLTRAGWENHEQAASELADSGLTRSVCRFGREEATNADKRLLLVEQEKNPQLRAFLAAWTAPLGISLGHSKDQSPQG